MKKLFPLVITALILPLLLSVMMCDKSNPYDPNNPDYIKTQITILIDSTGIDSLFYTDTPIRIGIEATAEQIMERLTKIVVDYGNGIIFEKVKPSGQSLLKLWCDSSYTFTVTGKKLIQVKAVTVNSDDILDSVYVTITGKGAYITTQPQEFATPFEEKDSLFISVSGTGTAPLTFQWYKDSLFVDSAGDSITTLSTLTGKTYNYLTIPVLSFSDSGNYSCAVSNAFGTDTSDKTLIRVIPETADSTWPDVYFASSQSKGAENTNGSISVLLSKPFNKDNVTVRLKVNTSSTASASADYTFSDTTITFPAGEVIQNVSVLVIDDKINEDNETVMLDIVSAKNAVLIEDSVLSCVYTIEDNDESQARFNTPSQSFTEQDTNITIDSIAIVLTTLNDKPATVDYTVISDSTTAEGDSVDYYFVGTNRLTFPAFSDTAWIKLAMVGDTLPEGDEIINLLLSNPTGGITLSVSNVNHTYTIRDNDIVTVAFDAGQQENVSESDSVKILTVSLSKKSGETVTCGYKLNSGTATGGGVDYTLQGSGTLTFPPNSVQQSIRISITEDNTPEPDETIVLELYTPSANAALGNPATLTAIILDNEIPVVNFKQPLMSAFESVTSISIPVTLSFSPFDTVTILYTIGASSTAQLNTDYSIAASPLVFAVGDTVEKNIVLTIVNDKTNETDETITLNIGVPINAAVGTNSSCTHTILDDEYVITTAKTGNGTTVPATDTIVSRGDSLILGATASQNWEFTNWTATTGLNLINSSLTNALLLNVESNGIVTAIFTIDTFTVTVNAGTNGSVTPTPPQKVMRGGSLGITATANSRHHFYKWNVSQGISVANSDSASTDVMNVQINGSVSAVFAPDTYSVSVAQIPSGAGSMPSVGTQDMAYGTEMDLSAVPNAGYTFTGWSITPAGSMEYVSGTADSSVIKVRILGNGTINANFSGVTYTVKVSSNNQNYGTVTPTIQQVSHNGSFQIISLKKQGCRFLNWVLDSGIMSIDDLQKDTTTVISVLSNGGIRAIFAEADPVPDNVVCVDINSISPAGQEDGSTWYHAYKNLESAITDCTTAGTEFWIAEGTYTPSGSDSFKPKSNTSFCGGFSSHDSLLVERDFVGNRVVLDGGVGANCVHVVYGVENISINGFQITGQITGVNIEGGNVKLENCILSDLKEYAVFIWSDYGNRIKNCVFTNNRGASGCALYLKLSPEVTVENCIFYNNSTSGNGVIYTKSSLVNIIHSIIVNNTSTSTDSSTAGIYKLSGSTIKLVNSIIWNNTPTGISKGSQINKLLTSDNDYVYYCLIENYDNGGIFENDLNSGNFDHVIKLVPLFKSLVNPGGNNNEKWFTSQSGLIYENNQSPGVGDGGVSVLINLNYDIRGDGFVRKVNQYDMGAYELQ